MAAIDIDIVSYVQINDMRRDDNVMREVANWLLASPSDLITMRLRCLMLM
jgi:hypothetical protein